MTNPFKDASDLVIHEPTCPPWTAALAIHQTHLQREGMLHLFALNADPLQNQTCAITNANGGKRTVDFHVRSIFEDGRDLYCNDGNPLGHYTHVGTFDPLTEKMSAPFDPQDPVALMFS